MKKYFILTYGCQMNKADSERIAAKLEYDSFLPAVSVEDADVVVINSCAVRQAAEDSVYGFGRQAMELKKKNPGFTVILTGCLVGTSDDRPKRMELKELRKRIPWIDEFWPVGKVGFEVAPKRLEKKTAFVPISSGCNNFCTYCVVPYTRGKEESRPFEEIISEIRQLAREGTAEIMLLGQNVNSYGKDLMPQKTFADILRGAHEIEGISRIKFLTAHPKDMTDELIETIASHPKIDRYLHFPLQAGDDEVLRRMNRGYSSADYIALVEKIRTKIPNVEIGTDIIVGFPGETETQFENTVKVMKTIGFNNAFIAMYSPRKGSAAYAHPDDVPTKEKHRRHKILLELMKSQKVKNR